MDSWLHCTNADPLRALCLLHWDLVCWMVWIEAGNGEKTRWRKRFDNSLNFALYLNFDGNKWFYTIVVNQN
jgi:hypothetical protein